MSSSDWTSALTTGTVSFYIISDLTAPSATEAMQVDTPAGNAGLAFQNVTGGPFKDSAISGWAKQPVSNGAANIMLVLRSQDNTTFIANPATYFFATCSAGSSTDVRLKIIAVVAGVLTDIVATVDVASVNGNPINTWQQFEFAVINSGTDYLFRISQWNGSAMIPILDAAAPIASFPALNASGSARFGTRVGGLPGSIYLDDIAYYSIT